MKKTDVYAKKENMMPSDMDGEYGFVNVDTGKYYLINEMGSLIYDEIDGKRSIDELVNFFTKEYNVEYDECFHDVEEFIVDIFQKGIILKIN